MTSSTTEAADTEAYLATARRVITVEAEGLSALAAGLDASFARAVESILRAHGRVIVSGMGKSGHIGPGRRRNWSIPPRRAMAIWAWSPPRMWC